ncbi:MAG: glycosyl transferase family 1 [Bacteroidetes bacterium]|nr:MAG: glycosyl transferase family 1 [Bacteroidota bacterium]
MKILQLCKKFPYPLKDGEAIAVTYLSKALRDIGCEITLLSMNTIKHYTHIEDLPADFDHYKAIHWTDLDNSINPMDAFMNLFSGTSYHVERFVSKAFEEKLIEVLKSEEFDIIQLETLYLAPYVETIKKHSDAQVVMRAHNVEHEIWDRISQNTLFLPKKWYLSHLTRKLRNYEINHLNDYDFLVALTDRDLTQFKKLGYKNGAMAAPIGIDTSKYGKITPTESDRKKDLTLCFIGSLDWMPNIEGLNWFLQNVWPLIRTKHPEVTLHVAGRNTPGSLRNLNMENVVIHGEVPDAAEFISRHTAMVVPLFSGSGMRVKILEGMALGKVIITTSMGMEGIDAVDKEHLLVADSPDEFVRAVEYCKASPEVVDEIGHKAVDFVGEKFNNKQLAVRLYTIYEEMCVDNHVH